MGSLTAKSPPKSQLGWGKVPQERASRRHFRHLKKLSNCGFGLCGQQAQGTETDEREKLNHDREGELGTRASPAG